MKKTLILLSMLSICIGANAQTKVKEVVTDSYNRNSLSVVVVQRGDNYDGTVLTTVRGEGIAEKFDANEIGTKAVHVMKNRGTALSIDELNEVIGKNDFGKEIVSYVFNRTSDGMMNDELVRHRGNYNADDQDVINSRASKIGSAAIEESGSGLISSSYVMLVDYYDIKKEVDDKGNVSWATKGNAAVYVIDFPKEKLDDFYEKTWIYDTDSEDVKEAKRKAFDNYAIDMITVANSSFSGSGETLEKAVADGYETAIYNMEKLIPEWNVTVSITDTKPLRAKIGKKESLKNGSRYRAYSYKEDKDGDLVSVKRGYLRATKIADNTGMATGETPSSEFYQISGMANIQKGWTIKQSNDLKLGFALAPKVGGLSKYSLNLDFDYITKIGTKGSILYALVSLGMDPDPLFDKNISVTNISAAIGAGYGIHIFRALEFMPYVMGGGDYLSFTDDDEKYKDDKGKFAYYAEAGLRVAYTVAYPLQIFVKANYDLLLYKETYYDLINTEVMKDPHGSGVGVQLGVKYTF